MSSTQKSHVVSNLRDGSFGAEVRRGRTLATLGVSRVRGAGATVWRKVFARRSLGALLAVAALAACDPLVQGNGVYAERRVEVGEFAGVWVSDGLSAVVTVGPGLTQSVTISGDENLVNDHLRHELLDPEGGSSVTGKILHLSISPADFVPVIPPRVVITRPALALVRGDGAAALEVRPAAGAGVAQPLGVVLEAATLDAHGYATSGATAVLTRAARATLHSDGPVTGSVSADSHLENVGTGHCLVAADPRSVVCP